MKVYQLEQKQFIPASVEDTWAFFSSPFNLEKITPDRMRFKILSSLEKIPAYEGMKIEYTLCPIGSIPIRWITLISEVNTPFKFKDIQVKGPYALWDHTHTFKAVAGGTEMNDVVRYALPLGVLGQAAHGLFVKKQLENIFAYRRIAIEKIFQSSANGNTN